MPWLRQLVGLVAATVVAHCAEREVPGEELIEVVAHVLLAVEDRRLAGHVRVARALPSLPKILASFRIGKVSYSKVRAMTRVATAKNEEVLLNVALHGTAAHVETQVRLYRQVKRTEALQQENLRHAKRELNLYQDGDGFWVLRGRFVLYNWDRCI